jgi:hypothetical protein
VRRRDGALRAAGSVTRVLEASGFARMRLPARALGLTHEGRYVLRAGTRSIAFAVR